MTWQVSSVGWDGYVAFRTRALQRLAVLTGGHLVEEPGLVRLVADDDGVRGGVLLWDLVEPAKVTDVLTTDAAPQWVALLPPAAELAPVVAEAGWDCQEQRTAMALDDLTRLREAPLPPDIVISPVAVRQSSEGSSLEEAVRLSVLYGEDPSASSRDLEIEAQLLRRLTGIRFFAALEADGRCVATGGSRVVDGGALVAGVATLPSHRRRGIGTAITAVALRAAAEAGAREAFLDSSPEGVGIYRRLGFAEIGPVCWCERSLGA